MILSQSLSRSQSQSPGGFCLCFRVSTRPSTSAIAAPHQLARCNRANAPCPSSTRGHHVSLRKEPWERGQLLARHRWLKPAQPVCLRVYHNAVRGATARPDPPTLVFDCKHARIQPTSTLAHFDAFSNPPAPLTDEMHLSGEPGSIRLLETISLNNALVWALACPACRAQISMRSPSKADFALTMDLEKTAASRMRCDDDNDDAVAPLPHPRTLRRRFAPAS